MLYNFDFEKDIQRPVLALALRQFDVDFFKDILGPHWEFYYERNFWSGICQDEENKEMNIALSGLEKNEDELIRQRGWSLKEVTAFDVSQKSGCYIGQAVSDEIIKNTVLLNTDLCSKYCLFIPITQTFWLIDLQMTNHYKTNLPGQDFEKLISGYEYPLLRLFHLANTGLPQDTEPFSTTRFCGSMIKGVSQIQDGWITGSGFAGMKLLLEDIHLFAGHGHKEWMSYQGRRFYELLDAVRIQRLANIEYINFLSRSTDDPKLSELGECCRDEWDKLMVLDTGAENFLTQLGGWFEKVIDKEERLFDFLSRKVINIR